MTIRTLATISLLVLLAGTAGAAGIVPPAPTPPKATVLKPGVPLKEFGKVLWQEKVVVGPRQDVCLGSLFYGPGTSIEFGIVVGRFKDRLFFRTDRKIVREWVLPSPAQPDSAIAWAKDFASHFGKGDRLFVECHETGDPVLATGERALRMGALFKRWVADSFGANDWQEAEKLGVPPDRLTGPPPERICPIGNG